MRRPKYPSAPRRPSEEGDRRRGDRCFGAGPVLGGELLKLLREQVERWGLDGTEALKAELEGQKK